MNVIAHRGASQIAPENTMSAFRQAYFAGADKIELDVHRTRDGRLVVIHDHRVDRTTNGKGKVTDLTFEEISKLDAGAKFSPAYRGEPVPALEDVLAWAKDRVEVFVEVKDPQPGLDTELLKVLKDSGARTRVISFHADFIHNLKPEVPRGVLMHAEPLLLRTRQWAQVGGLTGALGAAVVGFFQAGWLGAGAGLVLGAAAGAAGGFFAGQRLGQNKLLAQVREHQGKADAVLPFWAGVSPWFVNRIHAMGLECTPYTANDPGLVGRLLRNGTDGVITDTPERFVDPDGRRQKERLQDAFSRVATVVPQPDGLLVRSETQLSTLFRPQPGVRFEDGPQPLQRAAVLRQLPGVVEAQDHRVTVVHEEYRPFLEGLLQDVSCSVVERPQ